MNNELWQQANELYDQMADLSESDQAQLVQKIFQANQPLAHLLKQMMGVDADASFMSNQPSVNISETQPKQHDTHFGHFSMHEKIAVGGMGRVFKARLMTADVPVFVALKLVRKELISQPMLRRFDDEKQILNSLKHHHIAALVDAGVVDETPYLATEWVEGETIIEYCKQHQLNVSQKLNLFLQVCDAVAYAHKRLVIHRDLKPANILVDHNGQVKLLDFGIAKMLDADVTTTTQTQVFTPEYAAPEQVNGDNCSTTTDIYALGVLLFELLTAEKRFGLAELSMAGQVKAIVEPQMRMASDVMKQKNMANVHQVKGAIDTIINQAMHVIPERRYQSVFELINDIRRYQQRLPILAMGDGWIYRSQMMLQRHAWSSLFLLLLFVSLFTGLLLVNQQKSRAIEAQVLAQKEAEKSQQMLSFFMSSLETASPLSGGSTQISVKDMFELGSQKFDLKQIENESTRAEIAGQIAEIYGELYVYDKKVEYNRLALEYYSKDLTKHASKYLYHQMNIAGAYRDQDLYERAEQHLKQAYEKVKNKPLKIEVHAEAMINFGEFYLELNQTEKSLDFLQKAEVLASQVNDVESLGKVSYYQYLILQHQLPDEESATYLQQAQNYFIEAYPSGHPDLLAVRNSLAIQYKGAGDYRKANDMYQLIHRDHMALYGNKNFDHLSNHADTLFYLGQFEAALGLVTEAIDLIDQLEVEAGFSSMAAQVIQARCLVELGRYDEARNGLSLAYAFFSSRFAADHLVMLVLRSYQLDLAVKSGAASTDSMEEVELMRLAETHLNESNSARRKYANTAIIVATSYWHKQQMSQALKYMKAAESHLAEVSQQQDWSYWLVQASLDYLDPNKRLPVKSLKQSNAEQQLLMLIPANHWYHQLFKQHN